MGTFFSNYTAHVIKIDLELCTGCRKCVDTCHMDVIRFEQKSRKPFAKYPEECATCNWCEILCPVKAIQVIPRNPVRMPEPFPKAFYPKSYVED